MYGSRYNASRYFASRYYPKDSGTIEPPSDSVTVYWQLLGQPKTVLLLRHPSRLELAGLSIYRFPLLEAP